MHLLMPQIAANEFCGDVSRHSNNIEIVLSATFNDDFIGVCWWSGGQVAHVVLSSAIASAHCSMLHAIIQWNNTFSVWQRLCGSHQTNPHVAVKGVL
ncbi:hypothetical protein ACLKA6_011588 [Drosophila palustris]